MSRRQGKLASLIRPLGAYLPRPDLADSIVAPQYDNLTLDEVRRLGADNPMSFLNVVRSEIDHPEHTPAERHALLMETAAHLRELLASDRFDFYPPPAFFVCRLELFGHSQVGIVADVAIEAYERGLLKPHEETRRGQEDRLVEYMSTVRASFLPTFLIHRKNDSVDAVLAQVVAQPPLMTVHGDSNLLITFWAIDEPDDVATVLAAVEELDELYVADGHHRVAATARHAASRREDSSTGYEPYEHLTSVLFSSDQLAIYPYHRCVSGLGGVSPEDLLAGIERTMQVEPLDGSDPNPGRQGEICMWLEGRWYRIRIPDRLRDRPGIAGLDVTILQDLLLDELLGIEDVRTDPRIEFVPGMMGVGELVGMTGPDCVAFAVAPVTVDDLLEVSDLGENMPPKSTWFAPKLRSGLVVRLLDDE